MIAVIWIIIRKMLKKENDLPADDISEYDSLQIRQKRKLRENSSVVSEKVNTFQKQIDKPAEHPLETQNNDIRYIVIKILKWKELYDNQIISYSEFSDNKATLIDGLISKGINQTKEDFLLGLMPLIKDNIITDEELKKIKDIKFCL